MKVYMIFKSTETITIGDAFPSKATLLFRRFFFTIYDKIYVSGGDDEGDFENAHLVQRDVNMAAKIKFYSHFP